MSLIKKIFYELDCFKHKADVVGGMRISITFDSEDDKRRFIIEMERELLDENLKFARGPLSVGCDFVLYGTTVRFP